MDQDKAENREQSAPSKVTNRDMMMDFVLDVLAYVVAICITVKYGITVVSSDLPAGARIEGVVGLLVIMFAVAVAKKYYSNRSK